MLFLGDTEKHAPHSEGVTLLSKEAEKALIDWETVSFRIIKALFKTRVKKINMNVTRYYASTNDNESRRNFYIKLQSTVGKQRIGNIIYYR